MSSDPEGQVFLQELQKNFAQIWESSQSFVMLSLTFYGEKGSSDNAARLPYRCGLKNLCFHQLTALVDFNAL